jgi:hypothetical protein
MVASVADRTQRRRLQRDWTLAVAALHNSRYDGRSSREVLDGAVRRLADEPEVLFAAARLRDAIAARSFSGAAAPRAGSAPRCRCGWRASRTHSSSRSARAPARSPS